MAVPLAEETEDSEVDDALVVEEAPEEGTALNPSEATLEDKTPDELLAEVEAAEVADDDDELTGALTAPAFWLASELWMALSRLDGIQVVS